MVGAAIRSAGYGKGTSTSCLFSLFNLIFKLKLFYSFSHPCSTAWLLTWLFFFSLLWTCTHSLEESSAEIA